MFLTLVSPRTRNFAANVLNLRRARTFGYWLFRIFPPFPLIPSLKQSETFKLRDEGAEAADPDMSDRNVTLARARAEAEQQTLAAMSLPCWGLIPDLCISLKTII